MGHDQHEHEARGHLTDQAGLLPSVCWVMLLVAAALTALMDSAVPGDAPATTVAQAQTAPR